jgi:carbonic anhydrase/acetyltransferase-like protein (isoleucine patch superfamily)
MTKKNVLLVVAGMAASLMLASVCFSPNRRVLAQSSTCTPPTTNPYVCLPGMNIDPTAYVDPTVILHGKVTIGPYSYVDAGTILTGDVTIGHHSLLRCNITIRGKVKIGNYTHIYDNVNIEQGRPAKPIGGSTAEVADQAIIGDECWVNHGAIMHGTQIEDGGAVGLNTACDYNTHIGKGAILADGSATHHNQVIPENCFAEGVPAVIKRKGLTDKDRMEYFGLLPKTWTHFEGDRQEANAKKKLGEQ